MILQQNEIQNLFNTNTLTNAYIYDDTTLGHTWYTIAFEIATGQVISLCTQRNKLIIKRFKTLDSAYNLIKKIGFEKAIIKT